MNWDEMVEERAKARRKRVNLLLAMGAGDSVAVTGFALGFAGFLEWLAAVPFIIIGAGISGYMFWRLFLGNMASGGGDPT